MSERKQRGRRSTLARNGQQPAQKVSLVVLPLVVGLVLIALIAGAILSVGMAQGRTGQPWAASSGRGRNLDSASTAEPLATQPIPYPAIPRISLEDAQARLRSGRAVLVDVRSRVSYDKSHAAGSLSIPEDEIEARIHDLPHDRDLILYCT